jgi:site-specific recombinase XerD
MGADIYTIQKICGHRHIATTAIYNNVSDKKLRGAVDADAMPEIEVQ